MKLGQFTGSLLALALGDAFGAPHEGGLVERLLWKCIGKTSDGAKRWTDDTQMTLDLAQSLLAHGAVNPEDAARRFAGSYRWSRGYGRGTARVLKLIRKGVPWNVANQSAFPQGSLGNGAAMRSAARITHSHPLAIEGAVVIATATAAAVNGDDILEEAAETCESEPFLRRAALARSWAGSKHSPKARELAAMLGNGTTAKSSCVTALFIAVDFRDRSFESMLRFVRDVGGDVDTIGAMAGAIWGARNGAANLPESMLAALEARSAIEAVATELHELAQTGSDV